MQAPYPADVRAKGWRFELDMEKVKASDTWLRAKTGAMRGALLLLWSEAWQQTPCGSLPADDELVALLLDMSPAAFVKAKPVLMRGWEQADDGRLYHATITQRVLEMLQRRRKEADRKALSRAGTKPDDPGSPPEVPPLSRGTNMGLHPESDTGTGTSTRERKHPPTPAKRGSGEVHGFPPGFDAFWAAYPRKTAKPKAMQAFAKVKPDAALLATLLAAVRRQAATEQWTKDGGQFIPHPATWLNGRRWEDEIPGAGAASDDVFAAAR